MNARNNQSITTVSYRAHSLSKHAGKPGTAARTRRKERREWKRWEAAQVKEAQVLRYAFEWFFLHLVEKAFEELCSWEEDVHYIRLDILQCQVLKLKMEAVLQVGKAPKPSRVEKVWEVLNSPVDTDLFTPIAYGVGMVATIAATTAGMWLPPDHIPHSFGERKQDPTTVRFLTELRRAHNSVQR